MKKNENNSESYNKKNFTFITRMFDNEYKKVFPNAKLLYSYLLSIHYDTPISEDGNRYIDMTLKDIRLAFNCSHGLAFRMKNNLIAAGLIGEIQQPYSLTGNGRKMIVALYIKKIIE